MWILNKNHYENSNLIIHNAVYIDMFIVSVFWILWVFSPPSFKRKFTCLFWEIQYKISIREICITFSKMGLCFKYLIIFLKLAKLNKLMHFCHKSERLCILSMLKRLMTGIIWGTHVGPAFLPWVVLIKIT